MQLTNKKVLNISEQGIKLKPQEIAYTENS